MLTIPTAAQHQGDYSGTRNAAGNPVTIFDPRATQPSGSGCVRAPFAGTRGLTRVPFYISLLAAALCGGPAGAQTGGISGTVKDPSDAAVAGASVTLIQQETNSLRTQKTGNAGFYTFPELPPAPYRLEVEAPGFKRFIRANIVVSVDHNVAVDPKLEIGLTTESISVVAETSLLET